MIRIQLPGLADRILRDGGYPNDEPERWQRYTTSRTTRGAGTGYVATVELVADDWADILDHLCSQVEVSECMTNAELDGGRSDLRAARVAARRITESLHAEVTS